jgi:hypothetical protein
LRKEEVRQRNIARSGFPQHQLWKNIEEEMSLPIKNANEIHTQGMHFIDAHAAQKNYLDSEKNLQGRYTNSAGN